MRFFNYNGKYYEEGIPVLNPASRAFRYGDGLFETIKFKNKEFILLENHLERLWEGMHLLQFDKPKLFTKQYLADELANLVNKNKDNSARIRLTVFRAEGGLYDAVHHHPQFIIQSLPLLTDTEILNSNGLQVCIYKDALKSCDAFSNIKHNNYLPYFMGALFAQANHCNDAIILNNHLRICDSTIANIFIVKNEIMPGIEKNKNYITRHNMEITGYSGVIPIVRQKPGPNNSLGKVKFLFPNSYNIYLHDTPARSLFGETKRAFSHGCIRLSEPRKLAEFLLRGDSSWTESKIIAAMNSGKEKYVTLKEPVKVFIGYFTAWVDSKGVLNFRDDIYGHDARIAEKMFEKSKVRSSGKS